MAELNQYQKDEVTTATPIELVLIVYDECLRSLEKAKKAFEIEGPSRIEPFGAHLLHAQQAITELSISLDMEKGGDISRNLSSLYEFMTHHLSLANRNQDLKPVLEVLDIMSDLRATWAQVAQQAPALEVQQDESINRRSGGRINVSG